MPAGLAVAGVMLALNLVIIADGKRLGALLAG